MMLCRFFFDQDITETDPPFKLFKNYEFDTTTNPLKFDTTTNTVEDAVVTYKKGGPTKIHFLMTIWVFTLFLEEIRQVF